MEESQDDDTLTELHDIELVASPFTFIVGYLAFFTLVVLLNIFLISSSKSPVGIFILSSHIFGINFKFSLVWTIFSSVLLMMNFLLIGAITKFILKFVRSSPAKRQSITEEIHIISDRQRSFRIAFFVVVLIVLTFLQLYFANLLYPLVDQSSIFGIMTDYLIWIFICSLSLFIFSYSVQPKEQYTNTDSIIIAICLASPVIIGVYGILTDQVEILTFSQYSDLTLRIYAGIGLLGLAFSIATRLKLIIIGSLILVAVDVVIFNFTMLSGHLHVIQSICITISFLYSNYVLFRTRSIIQG